jgi:protein TonB
LNSSSLGRLSVAVLISALVHAVLPWVVPVTARRTAGAPPGPLSVAIAPLPAAAPGAPVPVVSTPAAPEPGGVAPAGAAAAPATRPPTPQPLAEVGEAPPAELPDSTPATELAPAAAPEREPARPALELPLPVDPEYLPARLLDMLPRPVAEVSPRYPEQAATQDLSGVVTLLLYIDELGIVTDVTVLSAEPPGYFEEAAVESFRNALFQPGQRDGRAVKSRLAVEVSFDARTDSHRAR